MGWDVGNDAGLEVAEREEAIVEAHLDRVHRLLQQHLIHITDRSISFRKSTPLQNCQLIVY